MTNFKGPAALLVLCLAMTSLAYPFRPLAYSDIHALARRQPAAQRGRLLNKLLTETKGASSPGKIQKSDPVTPDTPLLPFLPLGAAVIPTDEEQTGAGDVVVPPQTPDQVGGLVTPVVMQDEPNHAEQDKTSKDLTSDRDSTQKEVEADGDADPEEAVRTETPGWQRKLWNALPEGSKPVLSGEPEDVPAKEFAEAVLQAIREMDFDDSNYLLKHSLGPMVLNQQLEKSMRDAMLGLGLRVSALILLLNQAYVSRLSDQAVFDIAVGLDKLTLNELEQLQNKVNEMSEEVLAMTIRNGQRKLFSGREENWTYNPDEKEDRLVLAIPFVAEMERFERGKEFWVSIERELGYPNGEPPSEDKFEALKTKLEPSAVKKHFLDFFSGDLDDYGLDC